MSKADDYLKALAAWRATQARLRNYVLLLRRVTSALDKNPASLCFTDLPSTFPVPAEAALSASEKIDATAWPSAALLQEEILNFARARESAREAWADVPENLREGLIAPGIY